MGMIIHVGFGDCFKVAMSQETDSPLCGVEGTYQISSENAMRVMRSNKESNVWKLLYTIP
ncbi:uncharacterized protein MELLADRAFT_88681 [Melampsora larici-populina 98AG31]|uniref:Uncharacterized protein n=1 Tax=Melampsora larici-populina (strain 98AG31 / pathotype 3-4-7) TaxID=747676 RepID=F4RSL2_MELLP|nr:uncharacterized protein MELLADRAFT_88681 [Melampsora larici-populina 98AG31]EGG04619.1 hypothetical protein MELLADRAFT_88681 [Melampsora larici-populina 98AG31]